MAVVWIGAAVIAAFVRPDLRGPLAAVVDLDLAGHAEEAHRRYAWSEDLVREFDLDPDLLRPPLAAELATWFSSDPHGDNEAGTADDDDGDGDDQLESVRLAALLTEHGRDDIARVYYQALLHARRGDRGAARGLFETLQGMRDTARGRELLLAIDGNAIDGGAIDGGAIDGGQGR